MKEKGERSLHSLEKIVAGIALAAVLGLSIGFARAADPHLRSASVLVQDAASGETLYAKNPGAVVPIASITKLMTAIVVLDANLDLQQRVVVSGDDYDQLKGTHSRLRAGTALTRNEMLLLALMSSENRAAAALARTYPGGTEVFVERMNAKARELGMQDTRFVDPTGLDSNNVSSARDLARLAVVNRRPAFHRKLTDSRHHSADRQTPAARSRSPARIAGSASRRTCD